MTEAPSLVISLVSLQVKSRLCHLHSQHANEAVAAKMTGRSVSGAAQCTGGTLRQQQEGTSLVEHVAGWQVIAQLCQHFCRGSPQLLGGNLVDVRTSRAVVHAVDGVGV